MATLDAMIIRIYLEDRAVMIQRAVRETRGRGKTSVAAGNLQDALHIFARRPDVTWEWEIIYRLGITDKRLVSH